MIRFNTHINLGVLMMSSVIACMSFTIPLFLIKVVSASHNIRDIKLGYIQFYYEIVEVEGLQTYTVSELNDMLTY